MESIQTLHAFLANFHSRRKLQGIILFLSLLPFLSTACGPAYQSQSAAYTGPVLYAGYILYQKPMKSLYDLPKIPGQIIVAALNANNGKKIWQQPILKFQASYISYGVYVINSGNTIYAIIGKRDMKSTAANEGKGQVVALDAQTGNVLWQDTENAGLIYDPVATNGALYMQIGLKTFKALDASTGKRLWNVSTGAYNIDHFAVDKQAVFLIQEKLSVEDPHPAAAYDYAFVQALRPNDGTEIWHKELIDTSKTNANLQDISSQVGEQALRSSLQYVSVQADEQAVYLQVVERVLVREGNGATGDFIGHVLAFRLQDGSSLWKNQLLYKSTEEPEDFMIKEHTLYATEHAEESGDHAFAFNTQNGKQLWTYKTRFHLILFDSPSRAYGLTLKDGETFCSLRKDGEKTWCFDASNTGKPIMGKENLYYTGRSNKDTYDWIYVLRQSDGKQINRYSVETDQARVTQISLALEEIS